MRRGVELIDVRQDEDEVTATVRDTEGERRVTSRYLVGCDGAQPRTPDAEPVLRGGAMAEEFMFADVELDWDLPAGYSIRYVYADAIPDDDGRAVDVFSRAVWGL